MKRVREYLRRELEIVLRSLMSEQSAVFIGPTDARLDGCSMTRADDLRGRLTAIDAEAPRSVVLLHGLDVVDDVYEALEGVAESWRAESRIVSVSYNRLWRPFIGATRLLSQSDKSAENWIQPEEIRNLLEQSGFEVVSGRSAVLLPLPIPILGRWVNRWCAQIPFLRSLAIFNVVVARPARRRPIENPKVSVVVAARNEEGNIAELVRRLPRLAERQELVFVEGGSTDGTWDAIQLVQKERSSPECEIKSYRQTGKGKGDAVRLGFAEATGDIFVILDADLSVRPEELPRFVDLLRSGICEFANGSRLVYPMQRHAMQFLNIVGNRFFGLAFSYLLGQPVRDTLCGTKVLWATDYRRIAGGRAYFGEFDPFGDFDLLFGAARMQLRIRDVPVHYMERTYGSTNISRFRHGLMLLRMTVFAARKLRFV